MHPVSEAQRLYFNKTALRFDDYRALGWTSVERQFTRLDIFSSELFWQGNDLVLDVGCGRGDFLTFSKIRNLDCQYVGLDVSDVLLTQAKAQFSNGKFIEDDFLSDSFNLRADYIIANGTLSFKAENQLEYVKLFLEKAYELARSGIGVNFLSKFRQNDAPYTSLFYYYDPIDVLKIAFQITPNVIFKQHYLDNDFTLFLMRK